MPDFDFQPYLDFVQRHYSESQGLYTPTDAVLPLKVQSVEKDDRASGEQGNDRKSSQKTEQLPVLDGLRKYALGDDREHVLLAGRPGSGKSMALRQLVVALASEGQIPVLVQLKGNVPILDAIADELENGDLEFDAKDIKRLLRHQKLILLLDGINEAKDDLRETLQPFRERYQTTPMIFTTRDLSIGGDLGIGKRFEMKPLSPEQLREFVGKYLPGQGERLLKHLSDRLREISETPLLLKMLCDVFDPETDQLPQNKGELFQEFDRKYDQFKGLPAVSGDFRRFKSEVLQHLAFVMMTGDEGKPTELELTIDRRKAEKAIEDLVTGRISDPGAKAKEWLEDLLEHHLLQVATDNRRVEFRHQLVQEYYAAESLMSDRHRLLEWLVVKPNQQYSIFQQDYLNYLKWTETIAVVLSLMKDEKDAVQVVKLALDVDLMLGARLAGEVRNSLQPTTINLLLQLPLPSELQIDSLVQTSSDSAIPALLKFLEDKVLATRENATYALGKIGGRAAVPGLVKALKDNTLDVRDVAADALRELKPTIVIPLSLQLLEDRNPYLREIASEILGELRYAAAQPELLKKLKDSDVNVRSSAAISLGKIGCRNSIPYLLKILAPETSEAKYSYLSWIAAKILGDLGVESTIPILIEALHNPDSHVRMYAAESLGKFNSEAAVFGLLYALEDQEIKVNISASSSLSKLSKLVTIPVLLRILKDKNSDMRKTAMEALGEIGDEVAIPELLRALEDTDWTMRTSAVRALGKIKNNSTTPDLIRLLKHQNPLVRSSAAQILGKMGDTETITELVEILVDSDPFVYVSVVAALGRLCGATAIPLLLLALEVPLSILHCEIIEVLGEVLGELTDKVDNPILLVSLTQLITPKILLALKSESSYMRHQAALALGNLGNIDTVPNLIQTLADEDPSVRQSVVDSLGKIGNETEIPIFLKLLEDEDFSISRIAQEALKRIRGQKVTQGLLESLNNKSWYVRKKVIFTLGELGDKAAIPMLLDILNENIPEDGTWEISSSTLHALEKLVDPEYLSVLWGIHRRNPELCVGHSIHALQTRCKFYNYEVQQAKRRKAVQPCCLEENRTSLGGDRGDPSLPATITYNVKELTLVSEQQPIFNQYNPTIGVNYAAENSNPRIIQNIQQESQDTSLLAIVQIIQALEKKYTFVQDPQQAIAIIDAEFKSLEASRSPQWQDLLNVKRLYNGGKKAAVKVGEHFAQENVWGKGAVAFLEGISEDVK